MFSALEFTSQISGQIWHCSLLFWFLTWDVIFLEWQMWKISQIRYVLSNKNYLALYLSSKTVIFLGHFRLVIAKKKMHIVYIYWLYFWNVHCSNIYEFVEPKKIIYQLLLDGGRFCIYLFLNKYNTIPVPGVTTIENLVSGWMEADLNMCLQSITRKGRSLIRLNDWRSHVYLIWEN